MQVKNETQRGLSFPVWAWTLAAIAFIGAQVIFNAVVTGPGTPPAWARLLLGLLAGTVVGCYFLLLGYITRDARRRGMSPILWLLVAILIPNCLGIILYFILRQPLQTVCPQCTNTVQTGFNFCPRCSYKLGPSCPHCQRLVGENQAYCPYCGTSLHSQAVPA